MEKFNADWAKDVPCRNIVIYGYCKKQKEGCPFKHDTDLIGTEETRPHKEVQVPSNPNTVQLNSTVMPSLLSLNSLSKKSSTSLNQQNSPSHKFNAKISESFTPMGTKIIEPKQAEMIQPKMPLKFSPTQSFTPNFDAYNSESFTPTSSKGNQMDNMDSNFNGLNINPMNNSPIVNTANVINQIPLPQQAPPQNILPFDPHGVPNPNVVPAPLANGIPTNPPLFPHQLSANNPPRYPSIYPPPHSILQYHLYAPDPPPHLQLPLKPNERTPAMLFIPNNLREELVKKNLAALQNFPPGGALPDIVQDYYGLVPLDFHQKSSQKDRYNGHENSLFKVFSNLDGKIYILRRIHNFNEQIEPQMISKTFNKWHSVESTNVVRLQDCFLTTKFGDSSLCFIYDYYPKAISLYEYHFVNFPLVPITQNYLWVYLIQLTNAIREVHSKKLVINCLDWEKVIVTGDPGRIKISSCSEFYPFFSKEELSFDEIKIKQQEDYIKLGAMLFELCKNISSDSNSEDVEIEKLNIDDQFKTVLKYLLDTENQEKTVEELSKLYIDKIYLIFESLNTYSEHTENVLSKELENGRLFRLICKLNFIFGRIESRIDINWSESGEKFPIILFYDYVFHQVDSHGKYLMDLTHVLRCLNKLDAGVSEKLILATPDEMNCIIISYKELKELINSTFRSLTQ